MKKGIHSLILTSIALVYFVSISGCQKEEVGCTQYGALNYNSRATIDNGTCQFSGKAVFWFDSPRDYATVYLNNSQSYIMQYYPTTLPSCGSNGCANFTLPAGTYTYHAESVVSIWDGSMTVYAGECSLILLN